MPDTNFSRCLSGVIGRRRINASARFDEANNKTLASAVNGIIIYGLPY